jgi:hypothetical protein
MHTEDGRFIGHQIRSEGIDCKLKELKAAMSGAREGERSDNV